MIVSADRGFAASRGERLRGYITSLDVLVF
jgi:hypothetical protein